MSHLPSNISFEKAGYFYEMVSAYITAIVGLESVAHPLNPMGFKSNEVATLEGKVHHEILIEPIAVHREFLAKNISSSTVSNSLVCMLMNTAYESIKILNDGTPEFEYFRHIRNASSHSNIFNFFNKEPSKPAAWRGDSIDHSRQGASNPLYGSPCFGNKLAAADALVLLWDIEQKLNKKI